ncbi:helix-turn-helix domain-containing protein [Streptomyces sp. NPDC060028]|uniref:AlbA family DNA-binding domain-containing protein n=1 Tax=Streptomyces sp. NPDC060028 TaxID=3347041 RepID=UPI0036AAFC7D
MRRQQALIEAVLGATSADETRWLEWKSSLDVSKPEGAFSVARAILGFANRMPDVASQWAGGHAYLLVGVEENALHGVSTHDVEKVDPWIARYVGDDFDRYQFTYVPYDNGDGTRHVMLVDVFPPKWGDPIHPLRKMHEKAYAGTVFHRSPGRTLPAGPAEIDALTERARRAAQRINVAVDITAGAVALVPFSPDTIKESLTGAREKLLAQLPGTGPAKTDLAFPAWSDPLAVPDRRSHDEFREEVEQYLQDHAAAMEKTLLRATGRTGSALRVKLTNPGETFLAKVEVVLTVPGPAQAYAWDEDDDVKTPKAPAKYGHRDFALTGILGLQRFPTPFVPLDHVPQIQQDGERTVIRFSPLDLRPHETIELHSVTLYSYRETAGTDVQWRATATNVSGHAQGRFTIPAQSVHADDVEKAAGLPPR